MTRFARAKGSKASNERVEEEATPWEQLKASITTGKKHFDVEDLEDDVDLKEEILSGNFAMTQCIFPLLI